MRQALEASNDRPAVLIHLIGELSAEEADALHEAYQRAGPFPRRGDFRFPQ
jgi:anti-anti-sigma regulatory factor